LDRLTEAKDISNQALARKLDEEALHTNLYSLAFLQGDSAEMIKQAAWFEGKPDVENEILGQESCSEAYYGQLKKARELTQRTVASAERAQNKEVAAFWSADGALREALLGNFGAAREKVDEALKLAPGSRDASSEAGIALALTGDVSRAQATVDELNKKFPLNTVVQSIWLPAIHGQVALHRNTPSAAVELLKPAAPFELSSGLETLSNSCIYPAYIRGQAYLAEGQGVPAAAEFQKILDHGGLVLNCTTGALAHLGLARLCSATRHRQSQGGISRFPHALERLRPRHRRPQASNGGIREARAEQRVVQEGSSPSGAQMRGAISKSGGNSSLAEESRRYADV